MNEGGSIIRLTHQVDFANQAEMGVVTQHSTQKSTLNSHHPKCQPGRHNILSRSVDDFSQHIHRDR